MKCPYCNHDKIKKSIFSSMNGFDSYRCQSCNNLFEKNQLIKNFKNILITGNQGTGKTYKAKDILNKLNTKRNIIITYPDSVWSDLATREKESFQIIKVNNLRELVSINLSRNIHHIVEISDDFYTHINIQVTHTILLKTKDTKYDTTLIYDDVNLMGYSHSLGVLAKNIISKEEKFFNTIIISNSITKGLQSHLIEIFDRFLISTVDYNVEPKHILYRTLKNNYDKLLVNKKNYFFLDVDKEDLS